MNLVTLDERNGVLRIALTALGHVEIDNRDPNADICEFLEYERDNGELDWIDPADIGAMTDAPIICLDVIYPDESDAAILPAPGATLYVYTEYMLRDPLEELEKHGYVDFVGFPASHFDSEER